MNALIRARDPVLGTHRLIARRGRTGHGDYLSAQVVDVPCLALPCRGAHRNKYYLPRRALTATRTAAATPPITQ
jgi:hypothetical protein